MKPFFIIRQNMKEIQLTKGYFTIVDDDDYDYIMQWKWHVNDSSIHPYAMRNSITEDGKRHHIMMHRIINRTPDGFDTDHINGNGLDNRKINLRTATRSQNMMNRKPNKNCSSKFKGVYWHGQHQKWASSISINKKRTHIGLFLNENDAAKAYEKRSILEFSNFHKECNYD